MKYYDCSISPYFLRLWWNGRHTTLRWLLRLWCWVMILRIWWNGRHVGLRCSWGDSCWFKSSYPHHFMGISNLIKIFFKRKKLIAASDFQKVIPKFFKLNFKFILSLCIIFVSFIAHFTAQFYQKSYFFQFLLHTLLSKF